MPQEGERMLHKEELQCTLYCNNIMVKLKPHYLNFLNPSLITYVSFICDHVHFCFD